MYTALYTLCIVIEPIGAVQACTPPFLTTFRVMRSVRNMLFRVSWYLTYGLVSLPIEQLLTFQAYDKYFYVIRVYETSQNLPLYREASIEAPCGCACSVHTCGVRHTNKALRRDVQRGRLMYGLIGRSRCTLPE